MSNSNRNANSLEKVNWKNSGEKEEGEKDPRGVTFHLGKDGRIRDSQGQVIDLRDSKDFGKDADQSKPKKKPHISNQDMMKNVGRKVGILGQKKNDLPVK